MQVFIVGSVEETAQALDKRRLNKQIIECNQILDALYGVGKGWFNHPIVKMYKGYEKWLCCYKWYLEEYQQKESDLLMLIHYNKFCEDNKPPFLTDDYFTQMKKRLYTKEENPQDIKTEKQIFATPSTLNFPCVCVLKGRLSSPPPYKRVQSPNKAIPFYPRRRYRLFPKARQPKRKRYPPL